ncbi:MAG: hypothetical protein JKY95_19135 [Planctomycetaceae bacterium]|nr:hypothetical protein [Planctomycetaceae bacterium]MBL4886626.1 hypothetical protein [Planctomycetaceae bacterium]
MVMANQWKCECSQQNPCLRCELSEDFSIVNQIIKKHSRYLSYIQVKQGEINIVVDSEGAYQSEHLAFYGESQEPLNADSLYICLGDKSVEIQLEDKVQ